MSATGCAGPDEDLARAALRTMLRASGSTRNERRSAGVWRASPADGRCQLHILLDNMPGAPRVATRSVKNHCEGHSRGLASPMRRLHPDMRAMAAERIAPWRSRTASYCAARSSLRKALIPLRVLPVSGWRFHASVGASGRSATGQPAAFLGPTLEAIPCSLFPIPCIEQWLPMRLNYPADLPRRMRDAQSRNRGKRVKNIAHGAQTDHEQAKV